jgi:hypothetical protein
MTQKIKTVSEKFLMTKKQHRFEGLCVLSDG